MNLNNVSNIKVFAHDAAAANVVVAYIFLNYSDEAYKIYAYPKGPATDIFEKNLLSNVTVYYDDNYDFHSGDLVVTGLSGIHSNYEIEVINKAKEKNVKNIISLLDRAINVDERFIIKEGNLTDYLPRKILVPSSKKNLSAYDEINNILESYENPYWKYIYEKCYKSPPNITDIIVEEYKHKYIVFFTEYIKEQYCDTLGYNEYTVMKDFVEVFKNINIPIFIKLHPSEDEKKYDQYVPNNGNITIIKNSISTQELLYYSKVVFGFMSSVFYEAILIDRRCYSLQLNYKKDLFELTLEGKVQRVSSKLELEKIRNNIKLDLEELGE